jgi:hypothetical protein
MGHLVFRVILNQAAMRKTLLLLIVGMFAACSSSEGDGNGGNANNSVNATLDGVSLSTSGIQTRYFPNEHVIEVTANLSDGHHLSVRYGVDNYFGQYGAILGLAYIKISDSDGLNVYSTLYDMPLRYGFFDGPVNNMQHGVDFDFTGKLFSDEYNSSSPFRYFQCHISAPISQSDDTRESLSADYSSDYHWYSVKKRQDSAPGAPVEIAFNNHEKLQFRVHFDAIPTPGYYEFDNGTSTNITVFKFDETTETYGALNCHGLMQITEVSQNPKHIKGTFTMTAMYGGSGSYGFSNGLFDLSYN